MVLKKNRQELEYEARETMRLIVPELLEVGHMNPGRWQHIAETFQDLKMVDDIHSVDGFIYQPLELQNQLRMRMIFKLVAVSFAIILSVVVFLFVFNRRLSLAVQEKTGDLESKNKALMQSQSLLVEKEDALKSMNTELEQRVKERTESLELVNQELSKEVDFRKQKEMSLELLHQAVASSNSAVMIIDENMQISYASNALSTLTNLDRKKLEGQSVDILEPHISLKALFFGQLASIKDFEVFTEVPLRTASGEGRWLQVTVSPMSLSSDVSMSKAISHYVVVCEDISDLKMSKDKLEKMALYDPLTGLENRTLFSIRIENAVDQAKRSKVKTALLFIDVDHFKGINDSFGHDAGDEVLKRVAERLKGCVRDIDPVARVSGAELSRTIIAMAHNMGLRVVAEGVENEQQEQFLKQNSCDTVQGFYYGKPMSLKELELKFSDQKAS